MAVQQNTKKISYYPVNLNVFNRKVLFVGGSVSVARECQMLLESGAFVDILSKIPVRAVRDLAVTHSHRVRIINKSSDYLKSTSFNVTEYNLVFAYSNDDQVNETIAQICEGKGVMWTGKYSHGDFSVPNKLRRGHLKIAVSTDGISKSLEDVLLSKIEADSLSEFDNYALYLDSLVEKISALPTPLTVGQKQKMNQLILELSGRDEISNALRRNNYSEALNLFELIIREALEELGCDTNNN